MGAVLCGHFEKSRFYRLKDKVRIANPQISRGSADSQSVSQSVYSQSVSQSVSHYHTPTNGAHVVHTHTLVFFFFRAGWNLLHLFVFGQGSHFRMNALLYPSLSPIFLLAQILMRTDLGDEPDGPRRSHKRIYSSSIVSVVSHL